jgi:hypothetical protein
VNGCKETRELEVVHALARRFGIDVVGLQRVADAKRAERGGFDGRIWLVSHRK